MSRNKKSRKQGKLTTLLPTGPSKAERLANPDSKEARRKRALEKKRRHQRSLKKGEERVTEGAATTKKAGRRAPRLKHDPVAVAEASRALLDDSAPSKD